MIKQSLLAGAAAVLALAMPGAAAAQSGYGYAPAQNTACERQRSDDKLAGGIAGALIGGLIGGAIGNNIDDNDHHYRGHRGYRGYGRGYDRGYYRGHSRSSDNSDEVVVGALLGAVVGGIAGSEIAGSSSANCRSVGPTPYRAAGTYSGGSIPRTTDGLYGGPEVMQAPQYPNTPPPPRTYPVSTYPNTARPGTAYPAPPVQEEQECRTIYRETRLPDGKVQRDPVAACRNAQTGEWQIVTDAQDDELYGY